MRVDDLKIEALHREGENPDLIGAEQPWAPQQVNLNMDKVYLNWLDWFKCPAPNGAQPVWSYKTYLTGETTNMII